MRPHDHGVNGALMKILHTYFVMLVFIIGASGCSMFKPLPVLAAIEPAVCPSASQQQWALSWEEQQSRLMVVTQCNETPEGTRWQWYLLNQLGQRIATAHNHEGQVAIDYFSAHPASDLIPRLVEAWQLSEFELATLKSQSSDLWSFSEHSGQREIRFSGILRAEINYPTRDANSGPINFISNAFSVEIHRQEL